MELKIDIQHSHEIQKILCLLNVGVLECLLHESMTYEEAYTYFLRPYVAQLLEGNKADQKMIDLFENCLLLEDIQELWPNKLQQSIISNKSECLDLVKILNSTEDSRYWFKLK